MSRKKINRLANRSYVRRLSWFVSELVWWVHCIPAEERKIHWELYKAGDLKYMDYEFEMHDAVLYLKDAIEKCTNADLVRDAYERKAKEGDLDFTVAPEKFMEDFGHYCLSYGLHPCALETFNRHRLLWRDGFPGEDQEKKGEEND